MTNEEYEAEKVFAMLTVPDYEDRYARILASIMQVAGREVKLSEEFTRLIPRHIMEKAKGK
jgi:hypothetical protein